MRGDGDFLSEKFGCIFIVLRCCCCAALCFFVFTYQVHTAYFIRRVDISTLPGVVCTYIRHVTLGTIKSLICNYNKFKI